MENLNSESSDRLYAIMTRSPRSGSSNRLARVGPGASREEGFWTDTDPDRVWLMDRKTAEEVVGRLAFNQPQIFRAEKALAIIRSQAGLAPQPEPEPYCGGMEL